MTDRAHLPDWLHWARRIEAIAQAGLTYCESAYDRERYSQLRALAAEILSAHTGASDATVLGWFDGQPGYATPKVDVRAAVFRDDRVLLVQESMDRRWTLPGGYADVGFSAAQNVVKEVEEEAGLRVAVHRLYSVRHKARQPYDPDVREFYKLFFVCGRLDEDEPAPGHETLDAGFFALDALPPLSTHRVLESDIVAAFAARSDPSLPVLFD